VKPLLVGIIGTGQMAANFAQELRALGAADIVAAAVASRRRADADAFAAKHAIGRAFGSYEELAADPDIDVAYIATPHVHHETHTLLCLRSGKHVLCEKPLAINAAQADRMIECARSNGRFLMEALWSHFLPALGAAREVVASGALGRVSLVTGGGAFIRACTTSLWSEPS
jgi:predicted dehydrogenase